MFLNNKDLIATTVTTAFFTVEALLHYSIGRSSTSRYGFQFTLPGAKDAARIFFVVMLVAFLSTLVSKLILRE